MECHKAEYQLVTAPYRSVMPFVGPVETEPVEFERCPDCGDTMLPPAAAKAADRAFYARLEQLLSDRPIGDYITADEAAAILGKTRQALHQDGRVRRGFVYRVRTGRAWMYLRRSVEQYRDTGDGRFDLTSVSGPTPPPAIRRSRPAYATAASFQDR
jgi:hypothetical protein